MEKMTYGKIQDEIKQMRDEENKLVFDQDFRIFTSVEGMRAWEKGVREERTKQEANTRAEKE